MSHLTCSYLPISNELLIIRAFELPRYFQGNFCIYIYIDIYIVGIPVQVPVWKRSGSRVLLDEKTVH